MIRYLKPLRLPASTLALLALSLFSTHGYAEDTKENSVEKEPPLTTATFESQIRDQIEEGQISIEKKPLTARGLLTIAELLGYRGPESVAEHPSTSNHPTTSPITSVALMNCDLNNEVETTAILMTALAATQKSQERISLDLRNNKFTAANLKVLFSGQETPQRPGADTQVFPFSTIDLSNNPLGDDTTFDPEKSHNLLYRMGGEHLITLRLSQCKLGDTAAHSIAASLAMWKGRKINLLLDLSHNEITEKGAQALLQELKALHQTGKGLNITFDLSDNPLTNPIAQLFLQALKNDEISSTVHFTLPSTISADIIAEFRELHSAE